MFLFSTLSFLSVGFSAFWPPVHHITHFSAGAVSRGKNFDEESNASMSTARDETRDGFYMEDGDPSVAQLLHERTFAFSFWPKVGSVLLL